MFRRVYGVDALRSRNKLTSGVVAASTGSFPWASPVRISDAADEIPGPLASHGGEGPFVEPEAIAPGVPHVYIARKKGKSHKYHVPDYIAARGTPGPPRGHVSW